MIDPRTESEGFAVGGHDIPDENKVASFRFDVLVANMAGSIPNSARYMVFDREVKKRLAKDSAAIYLKNVLIGACAGGAFGLLGVCLGAYLKSEHNITPSSTMQQVQGCQLDKQPGTENTLTLQPIASQPVQIPCPVQPNAQVSTPRP